MEAVRKDQNAIRYTIRTQPELTRGIVEKGSIAIDGISLTVTMVQKERFEVSVIPHTLKETTLGDKRKGSMVNLENDIIGKYVERLLSLEQTETTLTKEFLLRAGF